ncbi:MAG: ATP-binding protein [Saprospiraceae bacterium]|uniref:ATP-binding protein n=1 Tax=Candidatus Opimibacter skivensis TaxID=2982028 RepID=A0A9D7SYZ0_9BACT|nr:ATP-binding protein [Candidatus Opimibacter skivensis]
MVIIVFGLPGSGKSYFASRLAEKLDALYVSTDELRMKMFSERTYSDDEKQLVYNAMLAIMVDHIPEQIPIVLDGTFYKASLRDKFEQKVEELKEEIRYIEVTAPEDSIEERLDKPRKNSEANFDVYLKIRQVTEPLLKEHLVLVSSNDNIDAMLREAIHYLDLRK